MSQISRLHSTEIANGNLIDATHINNELNQLVAESNSQDTHITTAESNITNHTNSLKSVITGLVVQYSTANRVIIKQGLARDSGNTELIEVTSDITVDLSTSGANGLDTGTEASSTWYYLWLIKNTSTGSVAGLFSTSSSSPTLPSGYNKKRLLPIAVRNDASSNIVRFYVGTGWPNRPVIHFSVSFSDCSGPTAGTTNVLAGGSATTFTAVSVTNYVPVAISKIATFCISSTTATDGFQIRTDSTLANARFINNAGYNHSFVPIEINNSNQIEYKRGSGTGSCYIDIADFTVTEVF